VLAIAMTTVVHSNKTVTTIAMAAPYRMKERSALRAAPLAPAPAAVAAVATHPAPIRLIAKPKLILRLT